MTAANAPRPSDPRDEPKCYHPDCGGKPRRFCPYGGNHPPTPAPPRRRLGGGW